jgi:hypothetical protein
MNNVPPQGSSQWGSNQVPILQAQAIPYDGKVTANADANLTTIDQLLGSMNGMGTGADMAFVVYAMQIQKMNQTVSDSLKNIQYTSKLRDAMSKDLAKLRQLKSMIDRNRNNDPQDRANTEALVKDHAKSMGLNPENKEHFDKAQRDFHNTYPMNERTYSLDKDGGVVTQNSTTKHLSKDCGRDGWAIYSKDVEARIDNLSDQVKKLDSDREIKMIMLNQTLNKKGNAVSQLTNMIKQAHNTEQSIINNLK